MKNIVLVLILTALSHTLYSQDFTFGQFSAAEMDMQQYREDSTAHALMLREFGKAWLSSADRQPLIYEYHAKIKLFDSRGFGEGTVQIPVYKTNANNFEEVKGIQAVTWYRDDNGQMQKAELDTRAIFRVNENRYWDVVKFTLPHLQKGCIIEYKYQLETHRIFNFHTWEFQSGIPKLHSEYEAHIPAVYNYNVALRGPYKLTKNPAEIERDCFSPGGGVKCDCSKITYIMENIPAFKPEEFMTSPKNFMSALNFELSDYTNLNSGAKITVTKEWRDVDYDMKHSEYFGSQARRTSVMKEHIAPVIAGKADELEKARAVYHYIQKSFKYNGMRGWGSDDGIKKAFDNHSGDVADINLALVAALSAAGINTEPVLLSTREHGIVNKLYPVESDFNYIIAKANIGDKSYLLDATDPLLPFGLLPLQCINDQGRVMNMDKPSYWIDLTASQKQTRTYTLDLTLQGDGKIKGTMSCYSYGYDALTKRRAIKKYSSVEEYLDNYDEKLKNIKLVKADILNLDSLDNPLVENYQIEINAYKNLESQHLIFHPFFIDHVGENPFKLTERTYPVDRGALSDDRFMLTLHLPAGYQAGPLPQNVGSTMPSNGGRFLLTYDKTDDGFSMSHIIQFNRSVYTPGEYPYLKEMYNKIVQAETAEVVFIKTK